MLKGKIAQDLGAWNPCSRAIGFGRTLIAIGQISVLVFTAPVNLFPETLTSEFGPQCDGLLASISAYCLVSQSIPLVWVNLFLAIGLLVIVSGYRPRYTALLHFWISLSIASTIRLPDGGDVVAQIVTLLLIPVCMADGRVWQWTAHKPTEASWLHGFSWAFIWAIRVQMAYIYFSSGVTKIGVPSWSEGTAVYYVIRGEMFGTNTILSPIAYVLTEVPLFSLLLTWGTIVLELLLGILLVMPQRAASRLALGGSWLLHAAIIVVMGLFSFGFLMLGAVLIATSRYLECGTVKFPLRGIIRKESLSEMLMEEHGSAPST
jgi:antimicrobial peptide system SdpB family protein